MIDLAPLEAALAAATPLPWHYRNYCTVSTSGAPPFTLVADCEMDNGQMMQNAALIVAAVNALPGLIAEVRRLQVLAERLKLEAQSHAQEARTANATIAEIYQAVTGKTGEPGNWHGAEPVRAEIRRLQVDAWRYQWLFNANPQALAAIAWSVPAACAFSNAPEAIDAAIANNQEPA